MLSLYKSFPVCNSQKEHNSDDLNYMLSCWCEGANLPLKWDQETTVPPATWRGGRAVPCLITPLMQHPPASGSDTADNKIAPPTDPRS